ncbi:signal recognition particle receptor subunit alpha, partial [Pseudomonas aeruginosa]
TRPSMGDGMAWLFRARMQVDDDLLDFFSPRLLTADVGVEATTLIVQNLSNSVAGKDLAESCALYKSLQEGLAN